MDIDRLDDYFPPEDIKWKIGFAKLSNDKTRVIAKALAYVNSTAIKDRFDFVCGKFGWENKFSEWKNGAQLCSISVYWPEKGIWVSKSDGADDTNFEKTKGGLSDSFKRASYQWGPGRYLSKIPDTFVKTSLVKVPNWRYSPAPRDNKYPAFYWEEPELPDCVKPGYQHQEEEKLPPSETMKDDNKKYEEKVKEEIMEIKKLSGDSWEEVKTFLIEKYKDDKPLSNIMNVFSSEILEEITRLGVSKYLNDLPF